MIRPQFRILYGYWATARRISLRREPEPGYLKATERKYPLVAPQEPISKKTAKAQTYCCCSTVVANVIIP